MADPLLIAAGASAACGSAVLRFAWSLPRRSMAGNAAGWSLFLLGAALGGASAGAWGMAVASLWGMGVALLALTHAGLTSPAIAGARASNRRVGMLPEGREPLHLARRVVTFLIVCFAAAIVAVGLAVATRSLLVWLGASEANANVASLFAMPLAWALLAYALLMEERRARQWRLLALFALPGLIAAMTGLAA